MNVFMDADGLVLQQQGISSHIAEYAFPAVYGLKACPLLGAKPL